MTPAEIRAELFSLKDEKYADFHAGLIPTAERKSIIGVRLPNLRKLARNIVKDGDYAEFLQDLPHQYLDENTLHALIISAFTDYAQAITYTEKFLPYIDNWATCDAFGPQVFKKYPEEVYAKIKIWLKSSHTYTVRFGIVTLMSNFFDREFQPEMLELLAEVNSEEYYINMALAWCWCEALIKQYDEAIGYITEHKLSKWVHNKTLQKARESYRFTPEQKNYFESLKIK